MSPYVLPVPPRRLCVGAGALSPEKGGALRKQSTRGRRLGVAAVLCGGVFGAPLLLLQHGSAHASRVPTAVVTWPTPSRHGGADARTAWSLPSQLVRYESTPTPTTTTTTDDAGTATDAATPTTTPTTTAAARRPSQDSAARSAPPTTPPWRPDHRSVCAGDGPTTEGAGPGHVVRRGTRRDVRQPDAPVRDGVDGDECRHRGEHDVYGR